ncbi:MAG TPA: hypothetical protein VD864_16985 [Nocardioides sp.]|nr:hypothetical protein [Nocardioides sp.]
MGSRARWADEATDLSTKISEAAKHLTIGQLADATGLSPETISDSLTREKITNPSNPRGAIDRPAYRIGDVPLWSTGQLAEYARRVQLSREEPERVVTAVEAEREGLVSTNQVAELFGVHDQTVRRWERNYGDYPGKVARLDREGRPGRSDHLRKLDEVVDWAREKGIPVPESASA